MPLCAGKLCASREGKSCLSSGALRLAGSLVLRQEVLLVPHGGRGRLRNDLVTTGVLVRTGKVFVAQLFSFKLI